MSIVDLDRRVTALETQVTQLLKQSRIKRRIGAIALVYSQQRLDEEIDAAGALAGLWRRKSRINRARRSSA